MKILTFFNEKGGVGKSSFTMMYASWLKYVHGVKVGVADFNLRLNNYRRSEVLFREMYIKKNPETDVKPFSMDNIWPIVSVTERDIINLRRENKLPYGVWLNDLIMDGELADMDVVLCDFPGSLSGREFLEVKAKNLLNLVVIPVEREQQTITTTFKLNRLLEGYNHCMFLNKAELNLPNIRKKYIEFARELKRSGWPMLPDLIVNSTRMGDMDRVDDMRSTFAYPDFSQPQYGNSKDLGIENLFIDITRELDKTADIDKTGTADLSFINNMVKKNDGRQFTGSAYPQYEIK